VPGRGRVAGTEEEEAQGVNQRKRKNSIMIKTNIGKWCFNERN